MNETVNYREVRRGDVYWMRMDYGYGYETGSGRPVVIISSDVGNEKSPTLIGAYTTRQEKYGRVFVPVVIDGEYSWVKCADLVTFDRNKRMGKYITTLTDAQMEEVDRGLRVALDLDYDSDYEDEYEEEIEASDDEEEYEEEESENLEEKIADLELELKIARAAYDKLLAKVVDMKVEADVASVKAPKVEPPKEEKPPVTVEPPVIAKPEPKVDVNTATETALKKIGWDSVSAKAILANRPYETLEELKSLPSVTRRLYDILAPRMECVIRSTEKVNINTYTTDQIVEVLGCLRADAGQIVGWRNKHGAYSSVDELWDISTLSKKFVSEYYDRFTVGEVVKAAPAKKVVEEAVVEEKATLEKANVNTMTCSQIARILGCSNSQAGLIVVHRNKTGLFKTKDDLYNIPKVSRRFIEKNWEKFEL